MNKLVILGVLSSLTFFNYSYAFEDEPYLGFGLGFDNANFENKIKGESAMSGILHFGLPITSWMSFETEFATGIDRTSYDYDYLEDNDTRYYGELDYRIGAMFSYDFKVHENTFLILKTGANYSEHTYLQQPYDSGDPSGEPDKTTYNGFSPHLGAGLGFDMLDGRIETLYNAYYSSDEVDYNSLSISYKKNF